MVKDWKTKRVIRVSANDVSEQLYDVVVDAKLISTSILQEPFQHEDLRASASQ